MTIKKAKPG